MRRLVREATPRAAAWGALGLTGTPSLTAPWGDCQGPLEGAARASPFLSNPLAPLRGVAGRAGGARRRRGLPGTRAGRAPGTRAPSAPGR